ALLDADDRDRAPMAAGGGGTVAITEIAPALWKSCVASASSPVSPGMDGVAALARALLLRSRDAGDAARGRGVLRLNGLPRGGATALAVAAILIPRTSAGAKVVEDAIRSMGTPIPGWQTIVAETHRLRS